jgi:hypothetical protein
MLADLTFPPLAVVGFAYQFYVWVVYFPRRAYGWRSSALERKGYTLWRKIRATSSSEALAKYATEVHAAEA